MNQNHFGFSLVLVAALLGYFAQQATGDNLQIISTKLINASMFTGISLAFIKFTRGTQYDVIKEIFEEHNVAGALFIVGFMLALSLCLTVVS